MKKFSSRLLAVTTALSGIVLGASPATRSV